MGGETISCMALQFFVLFLFLFSMVAKYYAAWFVKKREVLS